jgi:hypothetical protein
VIKRELSFVSNWFYEVARAVPGLCREPWPRHAYAAAASSGAESMTDGDFL